MWVWGGGVQAGRTASARCTKWSPSGTSLRRCSWRPLGWSCTPTSCGSTRTSSSWPWPLSSLARRYSRDASYAPASLHPPPAVPAVAGSCKPHQLAAARLHEAPLSFSGAWRLLLNLLLWSWASLQVRVFGYSAGTAAAVGVALAQIGEFSFVLLSRAQTLRLVSHKMYLLLMGTTALSLVLTPFAFKLVPRFVGLPERPKKERSSGPGALRKGEGRDRPSAAGPSASAATLRGDPVAGSGGGAWGAIRGQGSGSWDVREAGAGYWGADHASAGGGAGGHHPDKAGAREAGHWSYAEPGDQPMGTGAGSGGTGAGSGGTGGAQSSLRIRGTKGSLASPSGLGPSTDGEGGGAPDLSLGGGRGAGLSEDFFAWGPPGSYAGGAGSVSALVSSPSHTPPASHHYHSATPFNHQHYPHAPTSSKPSSLGSAFANMFSGSAASMTHKQVTHLCQAQGTAAHWPSLRQLARAVAVPGGHVGGRSHGPPLHSSAG